jgi:hypothetical protein
LVSGSDTSITFYMDLGNSQATTLPEKHVITFNATTSEITESTYKPIAGNPVSWSTPTTRKVLANVTQDGTTPVFQYFPYDPTRTAAKFATPLSAANVPKVARVMVSFRTVPLRKARSAIAVPLSDDIYLRVVNPNPPEPTPAGWSPSPSCS